MFKDKRKKSGRPPTQYTASWHFSASWIFYVGAFAAYTSPHWPLQVDERHWIKYKGPYDLRIIPKAGRQASCDFSAHYQTAAGPSIREDYSYINVVSNST